MLRPPTVPPPRRAPTIPPIAPPAPPERPPFASLVGVDKEVDRPVATTLGGPTPASLRSPARRLPGIIESVDDSARTQPAMAKADSSADDTNPNLELPLLAPAISDPSIRLPPPPPPPKPAWAKDLASRVDAQLDDDFGTETPVVAPTRAELQALLNVPPDATRKQSLEEVERLHRDANMRRSEPELEFTRRAPYPTAEVREEDIEAAIEVAPAARTRTGPIGVAKKKPNE
jgi:hypothetical protein